MEGLCRTKIVKCYQSLIFKRKGNVLNQKRSSNLFWSFSAVEFSSSSFALFGQTVELLRVKREYRLFSLCKRSTVWMLSEYKRI